MRDVHVHFLHGNPIGYNIEFFEGFIKVAQDAELDNGMKETIINLLLFIPLGMYLQFFSKKQKYMSITMVILISFIFEILQYVFHIGVSDITDIIMNTLGGIIGMLLMFIFYKLLNKKINSDQVNIILSHLSLLIPIALFCSLFLL